MNEIPKNQPVPASPEASGSDPAAALRELANSLLPMREMIIGNAVMLGEIPAPTFHEHRRINEYLHRMIESGVQQCAVDAVGNGIGFIPGTEGQGSVLLAAGADSALEPALDHSITVQPDRMTGAGLSECLGVSVLAALPVILERLGIRFRDNLIFLAGARNSGRGNLEGMRYFLKNNKWPVRYGICLKGTPLGRLSYTSIGMLRGELTCIVPPEYDWTRFGAAGAVLTINHVINRIAAIPLPRRPVTNIVLGAIEGGSTYDRIARRVDLKFEIRSEDAAMVRKISEEIADIVAETEAQFGGEVKLDIFARREPGGIQISHPVVKTSRKVLELLDIPPLIMPSTSETSALIDAGIPAVTLGISRGASINDDREEIEISPVLLGITQVIGIMKELDGGWPS